MKRILKIIILLVLMVGLVGCNKIDEIFDDTLSGEELKFKLIETRNRLQKQNIIIKATIDFGLIRGIGTQEGSGVVIASDEVYYYIITNSHVVDYKGTDTYKSITVKMGTYFGDEFEPERLNGSTIYDLALFRVEKAKLTNELEPINIDARYNDILIFGEMVLAVGNPGLTKFNVTFGSYEGTANLKNVSYRVLRHNATIFEGNSGGALTDIDGNLLGINTWGYEERINLGFAIGLDEIHDFLNSFDELSGA
jgi:S1-C subfamily serine protease